MQDIEILGWPIMEFDRTMATARREKFFDNYAGQIVVAGEMFAVPATTGTELAENVLKLQ